MTAGPVPSIPLSVAMVEYRKRRARAAPSAQHPVTALEHTSITHDIKISDKEVVIVDKKPVTWPYREGYFVPSTSSSVLLASECADILAYAYTPTVTVPTTRVVDSNFALDRKSAGIPHFVEPTSVAATWVAGTARKNANLVYDQFTKSAPDANRILSRVLAMLRVIKPPQVKSQRDIVVGSRTLSIPTPFRVPIVTINDPMKAYRILALHRGARGEDNCWLSAMTAGYYIGAMTRHIDAVFWRTADLLSILRVAGIPLVVFQDKMEHVAQSIAANGYTVVVQTTKSTIVNNPAALTPKTITRVNVRHAISATHVYVLVGYKPAAMIVGGKLVLDNEAAAHMETFDSLAKTTNVIMWVAITPETQQWAEDNKYYMYYSVHAHAGHALVTNIFCKDLLPMKWSTAYERMINANVVKTYYPFARTRMYELDAKRYSYVNDAIRQGIVLRLRSPKVLKDVFMESDWQFDDNDFEPQPDAPVDYGKDLISDQIWGLNLAPLIACDPPLMADNDRAAILAVISPPGLPKTPPSTHTYTTTTTTTTQTSPTESYDVDDSALDFDMSDLDNIQLDYSKKK